MYLDKADIVCLNFNRHYHDPRISSGLCDGISMVECEKAYLDLDSKRHLVIYSNHCSLYGTRLVLENGREFYIDGGYTGEGDVLLNENNTVAIFKGVMGVNIALDPEELC